MCIRDSSKCVKELKTMKDFEGYTPNALKTLVYTEAVSYTHLQFNHLSKKSLAYANKARYVPVIQQATNGIQESAPKQQAKYRNTIKFIQPIVLSTVFFFK